MPRHLVERTFPDSLEIPLAAAGANACLRVVGHNAGVGVFGVHSYVTPDKNKTRRIHNGPNPEAIRVAAERNNLPVDSITEVKVLEPYFYRQPMRCSFFIVIIALGGCGKNEPPKAADVPALAPAPRAERKDMRTVRVVLPEGWTKIIGETDIVVFETPLLDGRTVNMRIQHAPAALATNVDAYVKAKLDYYWDKGCTAEIIARGELPGGFAATIRLTTVADPQRPKLEYYAVFNVGDQKLHCECEWAPDEKFRDQVAALCKSATW
jgi:uncharacterized protein DUF4242